MAHRRHECARAFAARFSFRAQAAALEGVGALWKGLVPRLVLKSLGSSLWYAVYMAAREAFRSAFQTA